MATLGLGRNLKAATFDPAPPHLISVELSKGTTRRRRSPQEKSRGGWTKEKTTIEEPQAGKLQKDS